MSQNATLLNVVESISRERQDSRTIYNGGDGVRIAGLNERRQPAYLERLNEAAAIVAAVFAGKAPMYRLQEAMTRSDFPILFGDIIDRMLLARYQEIPSSYRRYIKVSSVRDFRTVSRKTIDGNRGLLAQVAERAPYPERKYTDGKYEYAVKKYGAAVGVSWESLINDDLDALRDIPNDLALSARRTEEYFATDLLFDANGPDATFFASGNGNLITGNPALSVAGLQAALTLLASRKDSDGRPINITAAKLIVPPALEPVARNIMNALQIEMTDNGGSSSQKLIAVNWLKNALELVVNYEIPSVASSANGNTSWVIVQDPNVGRPIAEMGFLRGHEQPELFMKTPNQQRVGGGQVNPTDGDFESDNVEYKVRHVLGGTLMDPTAGVASNGSGS